jgi:hypothetical protein
VRAVDEWGMQRPLCQMADWEAAMTIAQLYVRADAARWPVAALRQQLAHLLQQASRWLRRTVQGRQAATVQGRQAATVQGRQAATLCYVGSRVRAQLLLRLTAHLAVRVGAAHLTDRCYQRPQHPLRSVGRG